MQTEAARLLTAPRMQGSSGVHRFSPGNPGPAWVQELWVEALLSLKTDEWKEFAGGGGGGEKKTQETETVKSCYHQPAAWGSFVLLA